MLKKYIKAAETKLIFIDEFQHIYDKDHSETSTKHYVSVKRQSGTVANQIIINHMKLLMEEARVAIIPVGVLSVEKFLNLDPQLVGRCPIKEYSRLEYWEFPDVDAWIDVKKEVQLMRRTFWYLAPEEVAKKPKIRSPSYAKRIGHPGEIQILIERL